MLANLKAASFEKSLSDGSTIFVKIGRSYFRPSRAPITCQFEGTGMSSQLLVFSFGSKKLGKALEGCEAHLNFQVPFSETAKGDFPSFSNALFSSGYGMKSARAGSVLTLFTSGSCHSGIF